MEDMES